MSPFGGAADMVWKKRKFVNDGEKIYMSEAIPKV
jgi:hypothetical protein